MGTGTDDDDSARHDALVRKAWALCKLHLEDSAGALEPPDLFAKLELRRSIALLEAALTIHPRRWQTHWTLGKARLRLGQRRAALASFERAIELGDPDEELLVEAFREASICALEANEIDKALYYASAAVARHPEDAGLLANQAIALVLSGEVCRACERIDAALVLAPQDDVSHNVHAGISAVHRGDVPVPTSMADFYGAIRAGLRHTASLSPH